jgi:hypothetical protein
MTERYLTVAQVAKILNESPQVIHYWVYNTDKFPGRIIAGEGDDEVRRVVVIPERDVERVKRARELRDQADAIEKGLQFSIAR